MTTRPEHCCACGKPTRSHNVAIDVSEHDQIGLPTLAGVCCHTCWTGETDGVPPVGELHGGGDTTAMAETLDFDEMVSSAVPVEELHS